MNVCLIQVPYHAGDARAGSAGGPARCVQARVADRLVAFGLKVRVTGVDVGIQFRDTVSSSFAVCGRLAQKVGEVMAAGQLPIVLAGGCDVSKGVLSGFEHAACGVVWFDAHGDFNTPESTISGYFPGMSMALITGHCYQRAWARLGNAAPIPEEHVVMLGVRELDPLERERLAGSAIRVVGWQDGWPDGDSRVALDRLAGRVREVYLHIDMDAMTPEVAPGVVDQPVPGGLSLEQMDGELGRVVERFRLRAATIATYNPERDQDDRTLDAVLHILESLAAHFRRS